MSKVRQPAVVRHDSEIIVGLQSPYGDLYALSKVSKMGKVGRRFIKYIIPMLDNNTATVRYEAIETLIEIGAVGASQMILRRLSDKHYLVRVCAAEFFGCIKDKKYYTHVKRLLRDRHPLVRAYAAVAMGDIDPVCARRDILFALRKERFARTIVSMLDALYHIGERREWVLQELIRHLQGRAWWASRAAASSLDDILEPSNAKCIAVAAQQAFRRAEEKGLRGDLPRLLRRAKELIRKKSR